MILDLPEEAPCSPEAKEIGTALEIAGFKVKWPLGVPAIEHPKTLELKAKLLEVTKKLNTSVEIGAEAVVFGPPGSR